MHERVQREPALLSRSRISKIIRYKGMREFVHGERYHQHDHTSDQCSHTEIKNHGKKDYSMAMYNLFGRISKPCSPNLNWMTLSACARPIPAAAPIGKWCVWARTLASFFSFSVGASF